MFSITVDPVQEKPEIVSKRASSKFDQVKTPEKRYGRDPIRTHPTQVHETTENTAIGLSVASSATEVNVLSSRPATQLIAAETNNADSLWEVFDNHSIAPEMMSPGVNKRSAKPNTLSVADSYGPSVENR
tara:strand:- start:2984 stop:3373 length:390 start_codon:yes stop_codon:yes gene_type:complete